MQILDVCKLYGARIIFIIKDGEALLAIFFKGQVQRDGSMTIEAKKALDAAATKLLANGTVTKVIWSRDVNDFNEENLTPSNYSNASEKYIQKFITGEEFNRAIEAFGIEIERDQQDQELRRQIRCLINGNRIADAEAYCRIFKLDITEFFKAGELFNLLLD